MMSKKRIALSLLLALLFFTFLLIKSLPANLVLAHAANQSHAFVPYQVSGSIWQGKAANIVVNLGRKPLMLGRVSWDISAWSLLMGSLSIHIKAINDQQMIEGDFQLGLDQSVNISDLTIAVDAADFAYLSPMPVNYQALAELTLQRLAAENVFNMPRIVDIDGNLLVKDISINFGTAIALGTYGVRLSLADKKVDDEPVLLVSLSDVDAVVEASGTVELLASKQAYDLNMTVKPTHKASPLIMQTLSQFYKRQPDGSYQLHLGQPL